MATVISGIAEAFVAMGTVHDDWPQARLENAIRIRGCPAGTAPTAPRLPRDRKQASGIVTSKTAASDKKLSSA